MIVSHAEAFDEFYHEMFPKLKRIAMSKFRDESTAEDLAQDTLLILYNNFEKALQLQNPRKWVYGVLQNQIKHELRSKARFIIMRERLERILKENPSADYEGWQGILDGLTQDEYQLMYLIYVEGYSNIEAAQKMSITYAACRQRVHRAKEKLRRGSK